MMNEYDRLRLPSQRRPNTPTLQAVPSDTHQFVLRIAAIRSPNASGDQCRTLRELDLTPLSYARLVMNTPLRELNAI
jgi:hypothetical protein